MRLEVLVATMNQTDINLVDKMNLKTDVLFINQTNENTYYETKINNRCIRMLSNTQRGLSKSRNQALLYAEGDICLIADDDIIYTDDYEEKVINAFMEIPDADIIVFNTTMVNYKGGINRKDIKKIRRAPRYKNYGSVRIAFKRKSFLKKNIWFNVLFGAGSIYGAGEETLVIREAVRKGLKIYEYPANIAEVDYSTSTWFKGYNHEYFYNKGAFLEACYSKLKFILKYYYVLKFKKITKLSYKEILKLIEDGAKGYKNFKKYED